MTNKCRVESCNEPVHGALHIPVWKKDEAGKVITEGKYESPILECYDLWYYCKRHYEIFGGVDKFIDKIIGKS